MWLLIVIITGLVCYLVYLQRQLKSINKQLQRGIEQKTQQPIQLQLIHRELNTLVKNVNHVLQQEQKTRQLSKQEQLYYKEMISNISHDFRTPLTSIKGYQQLLAKELLTETQQQKLAIANSHVRNLESLLETFFEYSYLLSRRDEPNCKQVLLNSIMEEYVANVFNQFEKKGIEVYLQETNEQVLLQSDETMIRRILQNLIQNALQHSNEDVAIHYWQEADFTYITFKNKIEQAKAFSPEQLFDRFYTIDQTRKRNSGLGLSIVRLLSERLGGSAHAIVENGTLKFVIKLANQLEKEKHGTT